MASLPHEPTENERTYPAVEQAQVFVLPSYQWMLTRIEAADSRIQALVALAATVAFAAPAIGKTIDPSISFRSRWLLGALGLALAVVTTGTIARLRGGLNLVNPSIVYDGWLHLSQWQFQRDALYWAGKHFDANAKLVHTKSTVLTGMTVTLALAVLMLAVWIVTASSPVLGRS
jgi:hypothetical protein